MPDTAYAFALDQYIRRADPASPEADEAYRHRVGDTVQLQISRSPVQIMSRHCGGFGVVYVVRSVADGTISAVKTPRLDRHDDPVALEDFAREATLWRNLPSHPFVLPALAVFRYDRRPYVEMPYVSPIAASGSSLGGLLADADEFTGLSSWLTTLTIGQLLTALAYLEESVAGFAHGDIKPANVLLDAPSNGVLEDVSIQLSDFGLARALSHTGTSSAIAGDMYYLPSEWLRPGAVATSPAGQPPAKLQDIYAFGCTAMELLLNLRWQAPDPESGEWRTLVDGGLTFDHLAQTRPDIGITQLQVLWRCVAVPAEQRWLSFRVLAEAWEEAMAADPRAVSLAISRTPLGAELLQDSGPDSNPTYQYLMSIGTTADEAEKVCTALWDASQHRAVGRIEQSSALLAEIRAAHPRLATALAGEAHGLSLIDRPHEAISLYQEAIELFRADDAQRTMDSRAYAAACTTLAQLLLGEDDSDAWALALTMAKEAVDAEPSIGRVHAVLGHALMAAGKFDESVAALETAARLDPGHSFVQPALRTARGLASGAFLDPVGIADLEPLQRAQARLLWTHTSPTWLQLEALKRAGRFEDMVELLTGEAAKYRTRGDQGGEAQALANLAVAFENVGRLSDAEAAHRQAAAVFAAIERPNSSAEQIHYAGLVCHLALRFEEAVTAHREAVSVFASTQDRIRHARALFSLASSLGELDRWDEAVPELEHAVSLWAELVDPAHEADAWAGLGAAHYGAGRPADASVAFDEALARYRTTGDLEGQGRALDYIGLALNKLGRPQEAISAYRESAGILSEPGHESALLRTQSHLIAALVTQGAFDEVLATADATLNLVEAFPDDVAAVSILNNAGLALAGKQRFNEAAAMHRRAADLYESTGNRSGQAHALNNMGAALNKMQDDAGARTAFSAAVRISAEAGDVQLEAQALFNMGLTLKEAKDFQAAALMLRRASDRSAAASDALLQGKALHHLAGAMADDGRLDEAVIAYEEAVAAHGRSGDRSARGSALHNLGMIRYRLGQYDLAVAALREDRDICHAERDTAGEAQTLRNLATVLKAADMLDEAEEALRSAAAEYANMGELVSHGELLIDLGQMLEDQDRADEALVIMREAAAVLGSSADVSLSCTALVHVGFLALQNGRPDEALAASQKAVSLSDELGVPFVAGLAYMGLGSVLLGTARLPEAERALMTAHAHYVEAGHPEFAQQVERLLAMAAQHQNPGESAR